MELNNDAKRFVKACKEHAFLFLNIERMSANTLSYEIVSQYRAHKTNKPRINNYTIILNLHKRYDWHNNDITDYPERKINLDHIKLFKINEQTCTIRLGRWFD